MTSEDTESLRKRLGLGPEDPCPSPAAFEYAEKITPKKGYFEIDEDDGTIGIYDKKTEIITVVAPDFDPLEPIPCYNCTAPMTPMSMKCRNCGAGLDPFYVWEYTNEEQEDIVAELESGRRLMWADDPDEAERVAGELREAGIPFDWRDEDDDGFGNSGPAIWVANADLGAAQNVIARPGVEG